jgi:diguanylate cyclase (GGDEF)-like protein
MIHESQISDGSSDGKNTLQVELAPLAEQMTRAGKEGKSPFLVIFDGMNMGSYITLEDKPLLIGRDASSCDVVIDDAGISRQHARLQLNNRGRVEVFDLRSTNGTYINGKRVSNGTMKPGDKVLFGQRTLAKFVMEDSLDRLYEQELWSSCTRDGLTGITNRSYFRKRLSSAQGFALRHNLPYTVFMFRVSNLGDINANHSMQAGDQALVQLVRTISDVIRQEDVFSRFDGNRLAILSMGLDHIGAEAICERIVFEASERRISLPGELRVEIQVHVTVGAVSLLPPTHAEPKNILSTVEANLKTATFEGGRPVVAVRFESN